jgi:hypothetical protein
VNFKTYSKSHKLKKRLHNAPENQRIFPNTQPAIIEEQIFARVQELRENKRRPSKTTMSAPTIRATQELVPLTLFGKKR